MHAQHDAPGGRYGEPDCRRRVEGVGIILVKGKTYRRIGLMIIYRRYNHLRYWPRPDSQPPRPGINRCPLHDDGSYDRRSQTCAYLGPIVSTVRRHILPAPPGPGKDVRIDAHEGINRRIHRRGSYIRPIRSVICRTKNTATVRRNKEGAIAHSETPHIEVG